MLAKASGGDILRDLFQQDDGGWLQDASLLDVMVSEKLAEEAEIIRAEGWKWVEVDTDFPYGHTFGMRRIHVSHCCGQESVGDISACGTRGDPALAALSSQASQSV